MTQGNMILGFIRIYEIPDNLQKVPHDLICLIFEHKC